MFSIQGGSRGTVTPAPRLPLSRTGCYTLTGNVYDQEAMHGSLCVCIPMEHLSVPCPLLSSQHSMSVRREWATVTACSLVKAAGCCLDRVLLCRDLRLCISYSCQGMPRRQILCPLLGDARHPALSPHCEGSWHRPLPPRGNHAHPPRAGQEGTEAP